MAYELAFALTGESQRLESALQRAAEEYDELGEASNRAATSTLRFNEATGQFIDQQGNFLSRLETGKQLREELNALGIRTNQQVQDEIQQLEILERAYQDQERVVAQLAARKEMLQNQLEGASGGARNMTKATSNANQAIFSLGDATQDIGVAFQQGASFGESLGNATRFAGNNFAFMAEQMILVRQQAGSTRAAFQALRTSMLGVGGFIVGLQLLISLAPSVISFFTESSEEAEKLAEKVREAADAVLRLQSIQGRGELSATELRRQREQYELQVDALEEQVDIQDRIRASEQGIGAEAARLREQYRRLSDEEFEQLRSDLRDYQGLLDSANEQLEEHARRLRVERAAFGNLLMPQEFEERNFIEDLQDVTIELDDNIVPLFDAVTRRLFEAGETTEDLREELRFLRSEEGERLMQIERQNRALEQQIEFVRRVSEERARGPRRISGVEVTTGGALEALLGERAEGARMRQQASELDMSGVRQFQSRLDAAREYTMSVMDMQERRKDHHDEMLRLMGMSETEFFTTTVEGLTMLQQVSSQAFGGMAMMFQEFAQTGEEGNERAFRAYKAFAIAEATAAALLAANKAWASSVNPILGAAAAAGALAAGMANVQRIRNLQFQGGGSSREFSFQSPPPTRSGNSNTGASNAPSINAPTPPRSPRPATARSASGEWVQKSTIVLPGGDIEIALERQQRARQR